MINHYLTFTLRDALYAVPVSNVQEVLVYTQPEPLPCTASCIEGLISSRGQGISVMNLCKRFELPVSPVTKHTRIIVVELTHIEKEHTVVFGAVADSVEEVLDLETNALEAPPKFGNPISVDFIVGIGKKDDRFVTVLNVDTIFALKETAEQQ